MPLSSQGLAETTGQVSVWFTLTCEPSDSNHFRKVLY